MSKEKTQDNWIYKYANDEKYRQVFNYLVTDVRYVLGERLDNENKKCLICLGINPSTAIPYSLDPTLTIVRNYANKKEYGAWYMINIYPQRSTDPKRMHKDVGDDDLEKYDIDLHNNNLKEIKTLLERIDDADVWCAWGVAIDDPQRRFLSKMLFGEGDIKGIMGLFDKNKHKLKISGTTINNHPSHPLSKRKDNGLEDFDTIKLDKYEEQIMSKKKHL